MIEFFSKGILRFRKSHVTCSLKDLCCHLDAKCGSCSYSKIKLSLKVMFSEIIHTAFSDVLARFISKPFEPAYISNFFV